MTVLAPHLTTFFQERLVQEQRAILPLRKGESVKVRSMAPEDTCSGDMMVLIRRQGRTMAVPLFQLSAIDPDGVAREAIKDWHYWVAQGYCF